MEKIKPFQALHYNPEIVQDISKVLCPPYDVIDARMHEEYYQMHPYNIIRLILGRDFSGDRADENKYTRAAGYLQEWLRRNILIQDTEPAVYFYEQDFYIAGRKKRRLGIIALMRLDDDGAKRSVYPHEHTHTVPKEDRFKLIKSVETNLSPIFTIFSDPQGTVKGVFNKSVTKDAPFFQAQDTAGIMNKIWRVTQKEVIDRLKAFLEDKEIFIADGHHRYEVARMFRDYKRQSDPVNFKDSYNYLLTYLTALEDEGLAILPTHRLISKTHISLDDLKRSFTISEAASKEELVSNMEAKKADIGVFGMYKDSRFYLLKLSDKRECSQLIHNGPKEYKRLDVVILQKIIFDYILKIGLDEISYEVNLEAAIKRVDDKSASVLFILNPTKIEQIRCIALAGEVMPQKSTYFYPKLLSGLVMHKF